MPGLLVCARACSPRRCAPPSPFLAQLIDGDKDSAISLADLRTYLATVGEVVPADVVQAMLDAADSDSDGKLTFEDFQRLAKVIDAGAA